MIISTDAYNQNELYDIDRVIYCSIDPFRKMGSVYCGRCELWTTDGTAVNDSSSSIISSMLFTRKCK